MRRRRLKAALMGLAGVALVLAAALAGFNLLTDPFGVFGDRVYGWWSYDLTQNTASAKLSYLSHRRGEYGAYILGGSAAGDLSSAAVERYTGEPCYNCAVPGADLAAVERLAEHLLEQGGARHLVVCVDRSVPAAGGGAEMGRLPPALGGEGELSYYASYLFASPVHGLEKLKAGKAAQEQWLPTAGTRWDAESGCYDRRGEDARSAGTAEEYLAAWGAPEERAAAGAEDAAAVAAGLGRIRERCAQAGAELTVIVPALYRAQRDPGREQWLRTLAGEVELWDFSGAQLCADPRYFYDDGGFRTWTGEMMLSAVYGGEEVWYPAGFGEHLTPEAPPSEKEAEQTPPAVRLPIICYHAVTDDASRATVYTITAQALEEQLKALAAAGYETVSGEELTAYVKGGAPLPEKPVLLTFDDGYANNFTLAYPLLKKYGMKATIFAVGSTFGAETYKDTGTPITPHFGAAEAREMAASGLVSVQSHTYDFHQWAPYEPEGAAVRGSILPLEGEGEGTYARALMEDLERSRALLEGATGKPVGALAFPGGEHCPLAEAVAAAAGFELTVTTQAGGNTVTRGLPGSLLCLNRYYISDADTPGEMLAILAG